MCWNHRPDQSGGNFFFSEVKMVLCLEEFWWGELSLNFFFFIQPEILGADHRKTIQRNDIWILLKWWSRIGSFPSGVLAKASPKTKSEICLGDRETELFLNERVLPWIWPLGDTGGIGCFFHLFQPSPILGKSQLTLVKNNMLHCWGHNFWVRVCDESGGNGVHFARDFAAFKGVSWMLWLDSYDH